MPDVQDDGRVERIDPRNVVPINRVSSSMDAVTVHGVISRIGRRPTRRGRVLTEGVLADGSGRIRFASRSPLVAGRGDRVHVVRSRVERWRDAPELHLDRAHRIHVSPGRTDVPPVPPATALQDIHIGDRAIVVRGRIHGTDVVTGRTPRGQQRVRRGRVGDGSATVYFTDWTARPGIAPGRALRFENVYVRRFRDVPSVNLSQFSTISPADREMPRAMTPVRVPVGVALDSAGLADVTLVGTIVAMREGSGLVGRCPQCGQVIGSASCRRHGSVSPAYDLRTKAILDDGTGSVTVILGASITASIYGAGLEEARKEAHTTMQQDVVADRIEHTIVGRPYAVRGRLGVETGDTTLVARSFEPYDESPARRAARMLTGAA